MIPADILDLTEWKLTLPVEDAEEGAVAAEVEQPELDAFAVDPWFRADGDAVAFRANAGGATTGGSHYPRSELREMTADGGQEASWATTSGVHTMTVTEAFTHLPAVKPHAVGAQIHDAEDDVVMVRLEGSRLFVEGGGEDLGTLDEDYHLGDVLTVRLVAADGRIDVYYDDAPEPAVSVPMEKAGCYFKAGVYTQSNPDQGDAPDDYGEVEIYALSVDHDAA